MKNLSDLLEQDKKMQTMDEPSPPNAERRGLWRILAVSTVMAAACLGVVWILFAT